MPTTSKEQFTIRQGTMTDYALLLSWREAMIRDIGHTDTEQITVSLTAFAPWLTAQFAQPEQFIVYIGECDGTPVSCAMVLIHHWFPGLRDTTAQRGYIFNVYTLPSWRRHGYAALLVQSCVDWLATRGIHTVSLHASTQGQPVYARLGFHAPGEPEMTRKIE